PMTHRRARRPRRGYRVSRPSSGVPSKIGVTPLFLQTRPPSHHLDLVNGAAGFCDCGRMTIGELIEVLSELAESEDYDPASPVYLVSGNETTPRPLTEVEPDEDDDSLVLIAV